MEDNRRKLINYLKKNFKKGYTEESLRWALINQGYSRSRVEQGIKKAHEELSKKAPVLKEKPKIKYEIYDQENKKIDFKKSFWQKILSKFKK
jgi:hypothetical protein